MSLGFTAPPTFVSPRMPSVGTRAVADPPPSPRSPPLLSRFLLSMCAGWTDAVTIAQGDVFCSGMSGNLIVLFVEVGKGAPVERILFVLAMIGVFVASVAAGDTPWARRLSTTVAAALSACLLVLTQVLSLVQTWTVGWYILPAAAAMAQLNHIFHREFGEPGLITVVSGDIYAISSGLVRQANTTREPAVALVGFVTGALGVGLYMLVDASAKYALVGAIATLVVGESWRIWSMRGGSP